MSFSLYRDWGLIISVSIFLILEMELYETKIAEEKLIIKCCGVLVYSIPLSDITQVSKEGNLVTIKTVDWGVTMNKETMISEEIWKELVY